MTCELSVLTRLSINYCTVLTTACFKRARWWFLCLISLRCVFCSEIVAVCRRYMLHSYYISAPLGSGDGDSTGDPRAASLALALAQWPTRRAHKVKKNRVSFAGNPSGSATWLLNEVGGSVPERGYTSVVMQQDGNIDAP